MTRYDYFKQDLESGAAVLCNFVEEVYSNVFDLTEGGHLPGQCEACPGRQRCDNGDTGLMAWLLDEMDK